jgi:hypothetical protein
MPAPDIAARIDAIAADCDRLDRRLDAARFVARLDRIVFDCDELLGRFDKVWNESDHPRDEDGKFSEKGSGGSAGETTGSTGKKLTLHKERVWRGKPAQTKTPLAKHQLGQLGEDIAVSFLRQHGGLADAEQLHESSSVNFPLDLVGDHEIFEVKTGIASSGTARWRITIGQPGKAETEWLKTVGKEEKAAWNKRKVEMAIARKQAVVEEFAQKLGKPLKAKTIGIIVDPDTGRADVHILDGFHADVGWNSALAKDSYVGSFQYE